MAKCLGQLFLRQLHRFCTAKWQELCTRKWSWGVRNFLMSHLFRRTEVPRRIFEIKPWVFSFFLHFVLLFNSFFSCTVYTFLIAKSVYWLGYRGNVVPFPAGTRDVSSKCSDRFWPHPLSSAMGKPTSVFSEGETSGTWSWQLSSI